MAWVATIDALSAAIAGVPSPAHLSTTNATSAFVAATKDFRVTAVLLTGMIAHLASISSRIAQIMNNAK